MGHLLSTLENHFKKTWSKQLPGTWWGRSPFFFCPNGTQFLDRKISAASSSPAALGCPALSGVLQQQYLHGDRRSHPCPRRWALKQSWFPDAWWTLSVVLHQGKTRHFVLPSYFYMSVLMHIQRNPGMYWFTAHLDVPHLHVTGSTTRTTIIWPSNGAMQWFNSTWWTLLWFLVLMNPHRFGVARRSSERFQV